MGTGFVRGRNTHHPSTRRAIKERQEHILSGVSDDLAEPCRGVSSRPPGLVALKVEPPQDQGPRSLQAGSGWAVQWDGSTETAWCCICPHPSTAQLRTSGARRGGGSVFPSMQRFRASQKQRRLPGQQRVLQSLPRLSPRGLWGPGCGKQGCGAERHRRGAVSELEVLLAGYVYAAPCSLAEAGGFRPGVAGWLTGCRVFGGKSCRTADEAEAGLCLNRC